MTRRARRLGPISGIIVVATLVCACSSGTGGPVSSASTGTAGTSTAGTSTASTTPAGVIDGPVDIGGGRRMYLHCTGAGTPTVILESGYHDSASLWSEDEPTPPAVGPSVQQRLSEHVRVCSYDRPGTIVYGTQQSLTDRSTPVSNPRPPSAAVADLHALIAAAKLATPVVIVAHSMGGLLARLFTQTYPDQVAGLVFLDSFAVEMAAAMGKDWQRYRQLLATPGTAFDSDPAFEVFDVDAGIEDIEAGPPLPKIPMLVLSKTEPFPLPDSAGDLGPILDRAWPATQNDLVKLGTDVPHIIATGSDHYIQVREPDLVANAALVVIDRAGGS